MTSFTPLKEAAFTLRALSPGLRLGLGATALLAPWALRNDDRGYGRTALVTTPLLAAGFGIAPQLKNALAESYRSAKAQIRAKPFTLQNGQVRYTSLASLEAARQKGLLSEEDFRRWSPLVQREEAERSRSFWSALRANQSVSKVYTVQEVRDVLKTAVHDHPAGFDSLQRQLTAALYEAQLKSSTLLDRKEMHFPDLQKLTSLDDIDQAIRAAETLPEDQGQAYLRSLSHSITKMRNKALGAPVSSEGFLPLHGEAALGWKGIESSDTLRNLLVQSQGAETGNRMFTLLDRARRNGWIHGIAVATNDSQELHGFSLLGPKERLTFGLYNPATRQMRTGESLSQVAVARKVWRPNGVERLDLHLLEHLGTPKGFQGNWFQKLKEEIASTTIYSGHDPEDSEWVKALQADRGSALLGEQAALLQGGQLKASQLPIWPEGKSWEDLDFEEKLTQFQKLEGRVGKFGNEGSLAQGVLNEIEQAQLTIGLAPSEKKADATFRSLSKSLQVVPDSVPDELLPTLLSGKVRELYGGKVPGFGMKIGGVSPQMVAAMRALPSEAQKAGYWEAAQQQVVEHLKEDVLGAHPEMGEEDAVRLAVKGWQNLRSNLEGNEAALQAMRKLGSAGETDFLVGHEFSAIQTGETAVANVKSFHIQGDTFTDKEVIGITPGGATIQSSAPHNKITGIHHDGESWKIHYQRFYPLETGAKIDTLGHKGLAVMLQPGERESITHHLNQVYGSMGQGTPYAQDLNAFTNALYFQASIKEEPLAAVLGNTNEVMNRLRQVPGGAELATEYAAKFEAQHLPRVSSASGLSGPEAQAAGRDLAERLGLQAGKGGWLRDAEGHVVAHGYRQLLDRMQPHTMIENSAAATAALEARAAATGSTIGAAKAERLQELNQLSHELFAKASLLIRQNADRASQDSLFHSFLSSHEDSLRNYMERYYQRAGQAFSWDNTRRNIPQQVSVTYDMYGHLARAGEPAALEELLARAHSQHGDTAQAFEYAQHLFSPEAFQKPLGAVVPIGDGLKVGDLFDPWNDKFKKNFTLDLGQDHTFRIGKETVTGRYLPMMGLDAYKAAPNEFGAGERAFSPAQKELRSMLHSLWAAKGDQVTQKSHRYFEARLGELFGKGGILRPDATVANAVAAGIQTRGARKSFGRENPFDVVISRDALERMGNEKLRKHLEGGGFSYAKIARHPISAMPYVRVRLGGEADHLGPNMMGVSERLRSMLNSDDDLDVANLIFFHSRQAKAEARKVLRNSENTGSLQWQRHRAIELLQGNVEDSSKVAGASFAEELQEHTLDQMIGELAENSKAGSYGNIKTRLAHAETGAYSNLLTRLHLNLEGHAGLSQRLADRGMLEDLFFQIRQVPISAGKGKMKLAGSPEYLRNLLSAGLDTVDTKQGFRQAQDALTKIWMGAGKKIRINSEQELQDIQDIFGVTHKTLDYKKFQKLEEAIPLQVGHSVNVGAETMQQGRGANLLREFIENRNRQSDKALPALVSRNMNADKVRALLPELDTAPHYLTGFHTGRNTSRMADKVSETIGALNEAVQSNFSNLRRAFKPALPILGVGLGVAAAAGLLGTKLTSGHRPEETAGVSDHVPEQPVEGGMSSRPRVIEKPAPAQTRTAVVAPMSQNNYVEVNTSAPNRTEAAERVRVIDRLKNMGGRTDMTVNYQGSWQSSASSLRRKQQLREQLDLTS